MPDDFRIVTMPDGSRRWLYHHHTNSVSGQQPEWYWEWKCVCGWVDGDRDAAKLEAKVLSHVHA